MKTKSILVVEDEPMSRLIAEKLFSENYNVKTARNSVEALEHCAKQRFDAVLMDIELGPGSLNGTELMLHIRKLSNQDNVKVIAVTAYSEPKDNSFFVEEGFDDYFVKPYSRQRILQAFSEVLGD